MKYYCIGVLILVVIGGVFWYFKKNNTIGNEARSLTPKESQQTQHTPWIEILVGDVETTVGGVKKAVKSGDTIDIIGTEIKTNKTGLATVHFPDGSDLRLYHDTSVVINESYFVDSTDKVKVGVFLRAGRVWSKVILFANSESEWQVTTNNAVATVRGTAFEVSYNDIIYKTRIEGAEGRVEVRLYDENTKKVNDSIVAMVGESDYTQIVKSKKDQAESVVTSGPLSDISKKDQFRVSSLEADKKTDQIIKELQALRAQSGGKILPSVLYSEVQKISARIYNIMVVKSSQQSTVADSVTTGKATEFKNITSIKIILKTNDPLNIQTSETNIPLIGLVLQSDNTDGTVSDITSKTTFTVSGGVGTIVRGSLRAELDPLVRERGESTGEIRAEYTDQNGKVWVTTTKVRVYEYFEPTTQTRG